MSLRDLGLFSPLKADHPMANGERCWKCDLPLAAGMRVGLVAIETPDQTGSLTVEAKPVCARCHVRGVEVKTPIGNRIIDHIKDGDASSFVVITTDGKQWRDEEINPA